MSNFIYIDKIDGTGGFMIPKEEGSEDIIKELLKNPGYILRKETSCYVTDELLQDWKVMGINISTIKKTHKRPIRIKPAG